MFKQNVRCFQYRKKIQNCFYFMKNNNSNFSSNLRQESAVLGYLRNEHMQCTMDKHIVLCMMCKRYKNGKL